MGCRQRSRTSRETEELFLPILDARLRPMPGLVELLAALERKGIPKAIATSSSRKFVEGVLSRFAFGGAFRFYLDRRKRYGGKASSRDLSIGRRAVWRAAGGHGGVEDSATGCRAAVGGGPGRRRAGRAQSETRFFGRRIHRPKSWRPADIRTIRSHRTRTRLLALTLAPLRC